MTASRWLSGVLRGVWWISVVWLALTALVIVRFFIQWLAEPDNPVRYELAIAAALALFYSAPAAVGVVVAGIARKTGLSARRRIGGILLLVSCIAALIAFDFLQARYR